jgi:hypothetical protein
MFKIINEQIVYSSKALPTDKICINCGHVPCKGTSPCCPVGVCTALFQICAAERLRISKDVAAAIGSRLKG